STAGYLPRSAPGAFGSLRRGARAFRPLLQLPEEREHPDHPRARPEERKRNAEDQELRPEVAQRDQRYTGEDGPRAGNEIRRARPHHLAAAAKPNRRTGIGRKHRPLKDKISNATSQLRFKTR